MSTRLTLNIALIEMLRSATARKHGIANDDYSEQHLVNMTLLGAMSIQPIRNKYGRTDITSGYRGPKLNRIVGGSPNSQHCKGQAADIKFGGYDARQMGRAIVELGIPFDQLIGYPPELGGHVHISYAEGRNRGQILWSPMKGRYEAWNPLA